MDNAGTFDNMLNEIGMSGTVDNAATECLQGGEWIMKPMLKHLLMTYILD